MRWYMHRTHIIRHPFVLKMRGTHLQKFLSKLHRSGGKVNLLRSVEGAGAYSRQSGWSQARWQPMNRNNFDSERSSYWLLATPSSFWIEKIGSVSHSLLANALWKRRRRSRHCEYFKTRPRMSGRADFTYWYIYWLLHAHTLTSFNIACALHFYVKFEPMGQESRWIGNEWPEQSHGW